MFNSPFLLLVFYYIEERALSWVILLHLMCSKKFKGISSYMHAGSLIEKNSVQPMRFLFILKNWDPVFVS